MNTAQDYLESDDFSLLAAPFDETSVDDHVDEASEDQVRLWLLTHVMGPEELQELLDEGYTIKGLGSELGYQPE